MWSRTSGFPGGIGRTTSPSDFESLINDVQSRLFDVLPDDTWFCRGHGDDSTLGEQKPHIDEWREHGW
jgi:glyoxylase-like metal-dependent hydrolase (beta-lactamase superfamily II)